MVLDIEKILREQGISKKEFAEMLKIAPQNVSRTIKRLSDNYSEIEDVLKLIGYSDEPASNDLLKSQQRTIENLSETIRALVSK